MTSAIFVKPNAITRAKYVDTAMGWRKGSTLGCLIEFWGEHISLTMPELDASSMLTALQTHFAVGVTDANQLLIALCSRHAHFVIKNDDDTYCVNGLEESIEKTEKRKKRGEKGANARWGRGNPDSKPKPKKRRSKHCLSDASSMPQACDEHANAMLDECPKPKPIAQTSFLPLRDADAPAPVSALLTRAGIAPLNPGDNPDAPEPVGTDVWKAYRESYFVRYGHEPVRNGRTNKNCADLVKRLGGGKAVAVVRFYLGHNDQYYVRKQHPIGLCLADCEGLHTQMLRGRQMTATTAAQTDRTQGNIEAAQGALDILLGKKESVFDVKPS